MCIAASFKYRCVNALAPKGRWIGVDVVGREGMEGGVEFRV